MPSIITPIFISSIFSQLYLFPCLKNTFKTYLVLHFFLKKKLKWHIVLYPRWRWYHLKGQWVFQNCWFFSSGSWLKLCSRDLVEIEFLKEAFCGGRGPAYVKMRCKGFCIQCCVEEGIFIGIICHWGLRSWWNSLLNEQESCSLFWWVCQVVIREYMKFRRRRGSLVEHLLCTQRLWPDGIILGLSWIQVNHVGFPMAF